MDSTITRLKGHMERECSLLSRFYECETAMRDRIESRDWDGLEATLEDLAKLADLLVETEIERHFAFEDLRKAVGEGEEATFYQVVVHLPPEEREKLSGLYRAMKFSLFGIQTTTRCMDEHVSTINEVMHNILGELYPHRKGRIYSARGAQLDSGTNPILIDREL